MSTKARICLKCQQEFDSQGPHNRICPNCNKVNSRYVKISAPVMSPTKQSIESKSAKYNGK